MTLRANSFRALPILVAFFLNVVIGPLAPLTQLGNQPVMAALAPSTFNALDGNLTDDTGPETDWCTPAPNRIVGNDTPSGSNDTSFSSANNKEDSNVPTLALGTIPNNKDDLLREYVASETVGEDLFVYLAWVRADSTGTSTIDFEFNQSDAVSSNGVTKVRSEGDLLVTFDFQANPGSQGGYGVDLTLRTWDNDAADNPDPTSSPANTGRWVNPIDLDAALLAEGSVNAGTVTDCVANPNTDLPVATFGEAVLNLSDILGGDCEAFGSLFTKSRSSNSFSADLKDRIDPLPVDLSTCGQIIILKEDENGDPLGGATFTVTPNPFTGSGSLDVTDNQAPDDDDADGVIHLSGVEPDEYEVCEKTAPAGYIKDNHCQTLTVAQNGSAEFGPWENGLGDISWEKRDEQSGELLGGATFTLEGSDGAADGFGPITVVDNGPNDADSDDGEFLVVDLLLGTYLITETAPPTGYDLPADADQEVELSGQTASAAVAFMDPPRRDASVVKTADLDPVLAGTEASFTIVVTAGGVGDSESVVLTDENPADSGKTWIVSGSDSDDCADLSIAPGESLSCDFGTMGNGGTRTVMISMTALEDDCENGIANTATITADDDVDTTNNESSDSLIVECPGLNILKQQVDANGEPTDEPVPAGGNVYFEVIVWNVGPGTALNAVLHDELPADVAWDVEILDKDGDDSCSVASSVIPGQPEAWSADCSFGDLPETTMENGKHVIFTGQTDSEDCGLLQNHAFADADNNDRVEASATATVRCPLLVIEKSADSEEVHFVFDADGNVLSVEPEQVTWTLTYTLSEGPVSGAFISDPLPEFLVFVSASDGGAYDAETRTLTWDLGDLTVDGSDSVSFVTTVDPDAPEVDPIVNVATIDSNETEPDAGEDSIIVTSESELGGNPTPTPSVPNTALVFGPAGEPVSVPVELFVLVLIGSLGTLAYANVQSARRRR